MVSGVSPFTTLVGRATKDNEDLLRVGLGGRDVLWIPGQAKEIQTWLMVCAYMKDAGQRGVVATLQRLQGCCCWFRMEVHMTEFVEQCLYCMDSKVGEKVPLPLNKVSTKSGLNIICRLNPLVLFPVKVQNSFEGKYFRHLTRVLVRFPETKV